MFVIMLSYAEFVEMKRMGVSYSFAKSFACIQMRMRNCVYAWYTASALIEAYRMLSEQSRLSLQIFSQSPATKLKVLYNQKSSEQYQHPSELANKNHQRHFQIKQTLLHVHKIVCCVRLDFHSSYFCINCK